ncbi:NAD(P)/FAD-dependent oxidoreductase [Rhodococcus oryzae]|uniref:NAD(P)/FAD-dependent oxidoreductase n=1 Tax=Rhodococcus oryzae TaxID=2571143 RepID=A0ABY2RG92_9NOCA|nr:NAD(P)/FAD-dependent oxidoreductase [Rhodococcus oryzae]TJZ75947.1 NAD(P)/FAD-dependent oxidoreductase [Rhodococcus oryzae]
MTYEYVDVAIIGAGPGGITAAHHLQRAGIENFVILERSDEFGGSWRDNVYPGLSVDVPTLFYQFSFARKPDWSRLFPTGQEIQEYNKQVAEDLNLHKYFRGNCTVDREVWDDAEQLWVLHIEDEAPVRARFVINAVGGYVNAKSANDIEGIGDFTGTVLRPNSWDPHYDWSGKRVAVIGTGSSSVQIVPTIYQQARSVEIYQRTPSWILPKPDVELSERAHRLLAIPGAGALINGAALAAMELPMQFLCNVLPLLPRKLLTTVMPQYDRIWQSIYRRMLRRSVDDAGIRAALVPDYGILAKRPVLSSNFFPALADPSVSLVVDPIERVTADGIRTSDGSERPYDLIIAATGYELFTDPETYRSGAVVGTDGFDLADDYRRNGLRSYGGSAHPGLPNRWSLVAPQGYVGIAWHTFVDLTARHAVRVITETGRRGAAVAQVRGEAFSRWVRKMDRHGKAISAYTVDSNPGLRTYFVNSQGEALYYRPQTISGAFWFSRFSSFDDYAFDYTLTEVQT